ncbi:AMP-binding protein [Ilumatobacter sp.]|uniref:AMP-binding protein n=1 Tax=Ilumatobacter sp. TaxID=1967498 RepID=UPI003B5303F8
MYATKHAQQHPDRPAFIMASTGEAVSLREYEGRANQLAHLLRDHGLAREDHISIFMENNDRYLESCGAGERSGLYFTCINSYLRPEEMAYIADNSRSQVLITSAARWEVAQAGLADCPRIDLVLVVGGAEAGIATSGRDGVEVRDFAEAVRDRPTEPIDDERLGIAMLYSSGTTGRPKGIVRPLPDVPPSEPLPLYRFLSSMWHYREDMVYLSPAPLYHSAPQAAVGLTLRHGGTAIIMERFDPGEYLRLVERYEVTHSQLVPTMFSRMLKLPDAEREAHDLSSLEIAIHAAAPCPVPVKERMIDWWGPIIHEYYGATEGLGFAACDSAEWLAHKGTVGRIVLGDLHILDDEMNELANGEPGTIWFETASEFEYHDDPEKTAEATSADGTMTTVNDVGYVDDDGFLHLTDRATFMIISGGVNLYPQETENLLITHPKVADAAVFGVPNEDLGEEMKAVVQPLEGVEPGDELARELTEFCGEHLSRQKVPRSIDFSAELPRLPTGKLYKKQLRDEYWGEGASRIVSD